jgi:malate synthase
MGWGKSTSWVPDPAQARVERALREKREAAERQAAREKREAAERERRAKPNCRADKNVRRRG